MGSPFETYNALPNPSIGFTRQMTDDNGLQYLRARYYDPSLGMFLSRDPMMGRYHIAHPFYFANLCELCAFASNPFNK
ncbi:MAG: RHS repeat-associated core domain-containing protein [bacterium]|nr:RHS repeat-associated core domain-containing protein [bacterium]